MLDEKMKGNKNMSKEVETEVKENIQKAINEHTKKALENPVCQEKDFITEVTEEEVLQPEDEDDFARITLDFLWPQNELYFAYNQDEMEEAEDHYHEEREDIIGQCWRYAPDYTDNETGIGAAYIRNYKMKAIFEVVFHVDMELEATGDYDIEE